MAIAENKQVMDVMPTNIKLDLTATILIRPKLEVTNPTTGVVDPTKSGSALPMEITLAQLKALLA